MKKIGFTLAEILVTLSIIGIIAALTIPSLVQTIQDNQYKTAYKKAFADGQAAFISAKNEDEIVPMPSNTDIPTATANWAAFKSKFIVTKTCESNNNGSCWDQTGEHVYLNSAPGVSSYAFIDNQGRSWSMYGSSKATVLCDTNGFKGPNAYGRDRWLFNFADVNNTHTGGTFVKFCPMYILDYPNVQSDWCPSGGCYYKSWLTGST